MKECKSPNHQFPIHELRKGYVTSDHCMPAAEQDIQLNRLNVKGSFSAAFEPVSHPALDALSGKFRLETAGVPGVAVFGKQPGPLLWLRLEGATWPQNMLSQADYGSGRPMAAGE